MNLEIQNRCLLSKWLFKLEDGIWQQLFHNKYLGSKSLTQVTRRLGDSQFWASLMKVKDDFMQWMSFKIQNSEQTRFWEDKWLGNTSLKLQYPNLYNLVYDKHDTVHKVLSTTPLNVSFRRNLQGNNLKDWM